jgi:CRP-like cAMP-binding protein
VGGSMIRHNSNSLLARLDRATLDAMIPHLEVVRLEFRDVLNETHTEVQKVFFPHWGIISSVVELIGGGAIETGMIGKDGQFGAGPALDHKVSLNSVIIQVAGQASVMDADRFRELAQQHPSLREITMGYEQFFLAQAQQTAACNAVHKVEARTCKWLLRMHKLVGDEMPITQEFLAQMMGVRRTSVTQVAGELQRAGMIRYSRGRVRIIDLELVQRTACECHEALNSHYSRVFEEHSSTLNYVGGQTDARLNGR